MYTRILSDLSDLITKIPVLVAALDEQEQIVIWNHECERVSGYSAAEIINNPRAFDLLYPDPQLQQEIFTKLRKRESFHGWEVPLKARDGSRKVISWANLPPHIQLPGTVIWAVGVDVTERCLAQEALAESELIHRTLYDFSPDSIFILDEKGRALSANPAGVKLFGVQDEDELIGALPEHFSPERQADGRLSSEKAIAMEAIALEKGVNSFEWIHRRKNGELFDAQVTLNRIELRGRNLVQTCVRDITHEKKAEQTLRLDEARLSALLQLNQMSSASIQEITDFALEKAVELTGSHAGYLAFMNEDETVLTMDSWSRAAMAECAIREKPRSYKVAETGLWGEAVRQRRPVITNDCSGAAPGKKGAPPGHMPIQRHMNIPVIDEGKIVAVAGVGNKAEDYNDSDVRQLTLLMEGMWRLVQRRRAEEERYESEENLRITLNSIADAVISTDREGNIVRMNPVAQKLTCWNVNEGRGRKLWEIVDMAFAKGGQSLEGMIKGVLFAGEVLAPTRGRYLRRIDGMEHQLSCSAAPMRSSQGEIHGAVVVLRDVTEQSRVEEQLRQSQKMESLGQLAGGVAHDFNNMLGGILGTADLLALRLSGDEKSRRYVEIITNAAQRAADLTEKLLSFSRRGKIVSAPLDIHATISEVLAIMERSIDRRVSVVTNFRAGKSTVFGDKSQLQNAILNLGLNARDAMPGGGMLGVLTENVKFDEAYCTASAFELEPGEYVHIAISDTGVGMGRDVLSRLFEPFFTTKAVGRGTGLGLAAVYGAVKEHHGAVSVDSQPGKGSTFHLYLPADQRKIENDDEKAPADRVETGSGCILVIDDEEIMRITASEMLQALGYEVILAKDGQEGCELFKQHRPGISAVLLDMIMPRMDGRDCFRAIRSMAPETKIIMASGFARESEMRELMAEGAWGFLKKPYRRAEVAAALKKPRNA